MIFRSLLLSCCLITQLAYSQTPRFITDSLDAYVKQGMSDWKIPGLAIVIVEDGKVILKKGYGIREVGKPAAVDSATLFMIASNSKLFTATAIAKLDYEKKVSLDEKVQKYLPDWAMYDADVSRVATIRDLLSHRLGLKAYYGDFMYWDSKLSRQAVVNRLRKIKPTEVFRQDFGYSNAGYVTASEIIPKVTGKSWDEYVPETILTPLGMTNTFMHTEGLQQRKNVAYPYTNCCNEEGKLVRVGFDSLDNIGPAGGMVSNINDMSKWLLMQLDSGRYQGKQVVPWPVIKNTRKPNTLIGWDKHPVAPFQYQFYCLGIGLIDYGHYNVFSHTGGAFGYHSNLTLVPEKKLGIVILTNNDYNNFYEALRFQITDAYLGVPYQNRNQYFLGRVQARNTKQVTDLVSMAERVQKKTSPPIPFQNYTGTYSNPMYGTITVSVPGNPVKEGDLLVKFELHPKLTARLDYMGSNEFRLSFSNFRFGTAPALFLTKDGKGSSIDVKATDFVDYEPYRFSR